jgi:hypothetical protein
MKWKVEMLKLRKEVWIKKRRRQDSNLRGQAQQISSLSP